MEMRGAAGRWTLLLVLLLVLLRASDLVSGTGLLSGLELYRVRVRATEPAAYIIPYVW